jgi:hypothetical protein
MAQSAEEHLPVLILVPRVVLFKETVAWDFPPSGFYSSYRLPVPLGPRLTPWNIFILCFKLFEIFNCTDWSRSIRHGILWAQNFSLGRPVLTVLFGRVSHTAWLQSLTNRSSAMRYRGITWDHDPLLCRMLLHANSIQKVSRAMRHSAGSTHIQLYLHTFNYIWANSWRNSKIF